MNEEEGKFIEKLKKIRQDTIKANECGLSNNDFKEEVEVYDMVLSLLDKLQKENEEKNKQIDLMVEYIYNMQIECNVYYKDKKQVKQYFENLAKGE